MYRELANLLLEKRDATYKQLSKFHFRQSRALVVVQRACESTARKRDASYKQCSTLSIVRILASDRWWAANTNHERDVFVRVSVVKKVFS